MPGRPEDQIQRARWQSVSMTPLLVRALAIAEEGDAIILDDSEPPRTTTNNRGRNARVFVRFGKLLLKNSAACV